MSHSYISYSGQESIHHIGEHQMLHRIKARLIRLMRWEFWPFWVIYAPTIPYWIWLSIKSKSFWFFTAANPGIAFGGLMGESKYDIYRLVPRKFQPKTFQVKPHHTLEQVRDTMFQFGIRFPVIVKPEIGERGKGVVKVDSLTQLKDCLIKKQVPLLIQEYIGWTKELGIFYYRFPGQKKGNISSVVEKGFLSITGNGQSTLKELIAKNPRATLHWDKLKTKYEKQWKEVLPQGSTIELESIGNHCRGTTFLNGNRYINENMISLFDEIADQIPGFHFGRFDIRYRSLYDLYAGKNFSIIELNGAGAEPGHIYHPGASLMNAYRSIFHHLDVLYAISRINHRKGNPHYSFLRGFYAWRSAIRNGKKPVFAS
jgi:hypothetical protein